MANYYGAARTNYFKVKDEVLFRAWAEKFSLEIHEKDGLFCVFPDENSDDGTFTLLNEDQDDTLDICDEIAAHLTDDTVAVVMEAGNEKLHYISGWAVAINSAGERVQLTLRDIYDIATAKFGIEPTQATD